ncbi:MAG: hypothetical protein WDZ76_05055 [Pseudohongiellaceae bacterium]
MMTVIPLPILDMNVLQAIRSMPWHLRMPMRAVLLSLSLASCAGPSPPAIPPPEPLGPVDLQTAQNPVQDRLLDVGVLVFNAPDDGAASAQLDGRVVTEIAEKETHYLPYVLRNTLVESNQWGAVRVLPQDDPSVDLIVRGTIIQSDGLGLQLRIQAQDSTGREWINQVYYDSSDLEPVRLDEEVAQSPTTFVDPFSDIYRQIANDLLGRRDAFDAAELENIKQVSQMRYAAELSPETFSRTLEAGADGLLRTTSLPARDDPMLQRVATMKLRHHVFIDTVDEYYAALYQEMQPVYALWRSYSREQIRETEADQREAARSSRGSTGFTALSQSYNRYKWAKIYQQEFAELAEGFNNEVAPAILELNRQVHGLSGTLEEQYVQWRGILREIFELESGPAPVTE